MNQIDFQAMLKQVKENIKRLAECPGPHQFVVTPETATRTFGRRYRCSVCSGEVDSTDKSWYDRGFAHGRLTR